MTVIGGCVTRISTPILRRVGMATVRIAGLSVSEEKLLFCLFLNFFFYYFLFVYCMLTILPPSF